MSNTDQAPEPTMDEILASIRRIISDEPTDNQKQPDGDNDSVADDIARALNFDAGEDPAVNGLDDDILELTEVVPRDTSAGVDRADFTNTGMGLHTPADSVTPAPMEFQTAPPTFDEPDDHGEHPAHSLGTEGFPEDVFGPSGVLEASDANEPHNKNHAAESVDSAAFDDQDIFADGGSSGLKDSGFAGDSDTQEKEVADFAESLSETEQNAMSTAVSDSFETEKTPELGEALSWDSLEEEFGQEAQSVSPEKSGEEVQGIAEAVGALTGVTNAEHSLVEDESVTYGQISPEENLESALEQAISDIDPEAGWDDDDEDLSETGAQPEETIKQEELVASETENTDAQDMSQAVDATSEAIVNSENDAEEDDDEAGWNRDDEEESVRASGKEEISETQIQEGMSENMALSEAAVQQDEKDELADTLSAVKETVVQQTSEAAQTDSAQNTANDPEVSEVVPVQKQNQSPMQQQTAAAISPLEESIKDMLKPMLKEWLDDNMPRLLEGAMKEQQKIDQKK